MKIIGLPEHQSCMMPQRFCLSWHQSSWESDKLSPLTHRGVCALWCVGHFTSTQTVAWIGLNASGKDHNSRSQRALQADLSYSSIQAFSSATLIYPLWFCVNNIASLKQHGAKWEKILRRSIQHVWLLFWGCAACLPWRFALICFNNYNFIHNFATLIVQPILVRSKLKEAPIISRTFLVK